MLVKTTRTLPPEASEPAGFTVVEVDVQIDNLTSDALDERDLADQLIVGGVLTERLPPVHAAVAARRSRIVTYRYRVPLAGGSAIWQVTAPMGETIEAQLTIGAAIPNAMPDYQASIDPAALRRRQEGRRDVILIPVLLTAHEDVTIAGDAFGLWVGARRSALTPQEPLPLRLAAGESRQVVMAAEIPDVSVFEIQVGAQRWRVTLP